MVDFLLAAFAAVFSLLIAPGNDGDSDWIPVQDCCAAVEKFNAVNASVRSIHCKFREEKHIEVLDTPAVAEGTYSFEAPDAIDIDYLKPEKYSICIRSGKMTLVSADGKAKTVDLASNRQFAAMTGMLMKLPLGQKNFRVEAWETADRYRFTVIPAKSSRAGEITLTVDKRDMSLITLKMSQGVSDYSIFTFYDKAIIYMTSPAMGDVRGL